MAGTTKKTTRKRPGAKKKASKRPATKKAKKKRPATKKAEKKKRASKRPATKKAEKRATAKKKRPAARKKKPAATPTTAGLYVTREDGSRLHHDGASAFAISPFVPLIQKLVDVWVLPADRADARLQRLLNPEAKTRESNYLRILARELFEWGYYEDALDCIERALRLEPTDADLLELKVAAHENIGESTEARAWNARLDALRRRRPTDASYGMDRLADALVTNIVAVTARTKLTAPIVHLVLGLQDEGSIVPDELWLSLEGSGQVDEELSLTVPETLVPWHVDRLPGLTAAEDPLLGFVRRFQIPDGTLSWSDPKRLPASLFRLELAGALERAAAELEAAGTPIAPRCVLAVGHRHGDAVVVDRNPSRQRAREQVTHRRISAELRRLPPGSVGGLAEVCYARRERRAWLKALLD